MWYSRLRKLKTTHEMRNCHPQLHDTKSRESRAKQISWKSLPNKNTREINYEASNSLLFLQMWPMQRLIIMKCHLPSTACYSILDETTAASQTWPDIDRSPGFLEVMQGSQHLKPLSSITQTGFWNSFANCSVISWHRRVKAVAASRSEMFNQNRLFGQRLRHFICTTHHSK